MVLARRGPRPIDDRGYIRVNNNGNPGDKWLSPRAFLNSQVLAPARRSLNQSYARVRGGRTVPVGSLRWQEMLQVYWQGAIQGLTVDHIVELAEGGDHTPENLQLLTYAQHADKTRDYHRDRYPL